MKGGLDERQQASSFGMNDPIVASLIERETERQRTTLNMIAAESTSPAPVLAALGSVFNNKTAEGYPGRRYHRGCGIADELELLTVDRAKALFRAAHANVQVHSGVNANLAVYDAVLQPGDPVLSMNLSHGGHLSHGAAASLTGRVYGFTHYGVRRDSEQIDYDEVRELAKRHRPKLIVAGGSSYPRLIDYELLRAIADEVSAYLLVDMAHIAGLVAADIIPSPVPHADFVTMTTYKTLMGPHGGIVLCRGQHSRALDRAVFPGTQGAPAMSQIAAKAVCLKFATTKSFTKIQEATVEIAKVLAASLEERGYRPVSGGTDNHLVLIDLRSKGLGGDHVETVLEGVGILVNRNVIPFDPAPIRVTSGLRIGAAGLAIRGMGRAEATEIAAVIDRVLVGSDRRLATRKARERVLELCRQFPFPDIS